MTGAVVLYDLRTGKGQDVLSEYPADAALWMRMFGSSGRLFDWAR